MTRCRHIAEIISDDKLLLIDENDNWIYNKDISCFNSYICTYCPDCGQKIKHLKKTMN